MYSKLKPEHSYTICGDIEKNPGSKPNYYPFFYLSLESKQHFWTLKCSQFWCLSGTYLDSSILQDEDDLHLNIKRGDVCIYYKVSLPLKIKKIHFFGNALILK